MAQYRIVDINTKTADIQSSPIVNSKRIAIRHARMLMRLDTQLDTIFLTIVQKKTKNGWRRIWPDKGPEIQ